MKVIIRNFHGQESLLKFLVGFPGQYHHLLDLYGVGFHNNVHRVVKTFQGIRDHYACMFITHSRKKDGVLFFHNERKHSAGITYGTPVFVQDNDVYELHGLEQLIPDHTGKLDQFLFLLSRSTEQGQGKQNSYEQVLIQHAVSGCAA